MILVQGLFQNLKQLKIEKKNWNWLQFSEKEKIFCVACKKHHHKSKVQVQRYYRR